MAKIDFYTLGRTEKEDIFNAIATEKGMTPFAVEKDWWVSRTLAIIFEMDIARHLVFKGGTSLSKAWRLIHRFSEDIDLAIDREFFEYKGDLSKKKITGLRKAASAYSTGIFFEELQKKFREKGFSGLKFIVIEAKDSDQDPRIIEIFYTNIITPPSGYVLPRVQIEIGCRSLREPFSIKTFGSMVDEVFAKRDFAEPLFDVPTVNPERTLLEKLFLLHEEFHRTAEKMRVDRLSRHMYDLWYLWKDDTERISVRNKELYETIVAHRYKFARVGGVNYNMHNPKTLDPIPPPTVMNAWKDDYNKMLEDMIYGNDKPTFDMLIENLQSIKRKLRNLDWEFGLEFPNPA